MGRVVFSTMFKGGDLAPFVHLGKMLVARGHDVVLVSHAASEQVAREAGFGFEPSDDPGGYEAVARDALGVIDPRTSESFYRNHVLSRAERELEAIARHATKPCVVVGRSSTSLGARFASEKLGVPFVSLYTGPAFASAVGATAELLQKLEGDVERVRAACGLGPIDDFHAWLTSGFGGVGIWPEWFASDDRWPARLRLVGFLLASRGSLDARLEAAVSEPGAVLVTGGSGAYMSTEYFGAAIDGCRRLGKRAIVVAPARSLLPRDLPDDVTVVDYVEYASVFHRVEAVVHHGGTSTCGEVLAAGVPQLVMGAWLDRPDNGRFVERLGAGAYLAPVRWTGAAVADALARLTSDARVAATCRDYARRIEQHDVRAAACAAIEEALASAGAVTSSSGAAVRRAERRESQAALERVRARLGSLSPVKRELVALELARREARSATIHPARRDAPIPVAPLQAELLAWHRTRPPSATFNISFCPWIEGPLALDAFAGAVAAVCARHEPLRTRFVARGETWEQVIDPPLSSPLRFEDLGHLGASARDEAERRMLADANAPFALEHEPCARWTLLRVSGECHRFVFTVHKLVFGPADFATIWREITAAYEALASGRALEHAPPRLQYADFSRWYRGALDGPLRSVVAKRRAMLQGAKPLELRAARPWRSDTCEPAANVSFEWPRALSDAIDDFCRIESVPASVMTTAALAFALRELTGADDFVMGVLTDIRGARAELDNMVGHFLTQLPLRIRAGEGTAGRAFVEMIRGELAAAFEHRFAPVSALVDCASPLDSPSLRVLLNVEQPPSQSPDAAAGWRVTDAWFQPNECKNEMVVSAVRDSAGFRGYVRAPASSWARADLERVAEAMGRAVRALVER